MENMKIILVTGGNRGIGLEICRQLDALGHTVIMGSRDLSRGLKAATSISRRIIPLQLDVTDEDSISRLYLSVRKEAGKLDVLINNAGINTSRGGQAQKIYSGMRSLLGKRFPSAVRLLKSSAESLRQRGFLAGPAAARNSDMDLVKGVMETNFYGPWRMINAFLPLLIESPDASIINVSSGMGALGNLTGAYPAYSLSKASLNALTILFSNELKEQKVKVNAMCPGWVRTDMGGPQAPRDVGEGADTAVWLATAMDLPTGKFFKDRKETEW